MLIKVEVLQPMAVQPWVGFLLQGVEPMANQLWEVSGRGLPQLLIGSSTTATNEIGSSGSAAWAHQQAILRGRAGDDRQPQVLIQLHLQGELFEQPHRQQPDFQLRQRLAQADPRSPPP